MSQHADDNECAARWDWKETGKGELEYESGDGGGGPLPDIAFDGGECLGLLEPADGKQR
ncbi:hypothetical protein VKT23_014074 [Stygiomarasmius scandens]|uniref:Uncharacterized protein n=1 Tax=Marasmiellus scandens TaxID=2682957 RepID=A0ABR1J3P0_9AGAR